MAGAHVPDFAVVGERHHKEAGMCDDSAKTMSTRAIIKGRLIDSRPAWTRKKRPVCASLSVLCPALVTALWLLAESHPWNELNGYLGLLAAGLLYVLTLLASVAGFAVGILSLVRREPLRYLAVLGLIMNVLVPLWIMQHH